MHRASLETGRMLGTSLRPETGLRLAPGAVRLWGHSKYLHLFCGEQASVVVAFGVG